MNVSILTLDTALYEGKAQSVSVPGVIGQLQALDHHVPFVTALTRGNVKVVDPQGTLHEFPIEQGVMEIRPGEINILAS